MIIFGLLVLVSAWLGLNQMNYLRRCVTLAKAHANAWTAENGYWKSNVYALPSILPNCITCKGSQGPNIRNWTGGSDRADAHLFPFEFNLEILGRFLRYSASEIELINLAVLVPQWRFIIQNEFAPAKSQRLVSVGGRRLFLSYQSLSQLVNKSSFNYSSVQFSR